MKIISIKKIPGVFEHMQNMSNFKSVIGYFRASGILLFANTSDLKVKIIAGRRPFIALHKKQGLLFNLKR
jgi:hypothetical protein